MRQALIFYGNKFTILDFRSPHFCNETRFFNINTNMFNFDINKLSCHTAWARVFSFSMCIFVCLFVRLFVSLVGFFLLLILFLLFVFRDGGLTKYIKKTSLILFKKPSGLFLSKRFLSIYNVHCFTQISVIC